MRKKEFDYIHWRTKFYKLKEEYTKLLEDFQKLRDEKNEINQPY